MAGTLELGFIGIRDSGRSEGVGRGGGGRGGAVRGAVGVRNVVYPRYRTAMGGALRTVSNIRSTRMDRRGNSTILAVSGGVRSSILGGTMRSTKCGMG